LWLAEHGDGRMVSRCIKRLGQSNFQITTLAIAKPSEAIGLHQRYCDTLLSQSEGMNGSEPLEELHWPDVVPKKSRTKAANSRKNFKQNERTKAAISASRKGKSLGTQNSMNDPEARKKVGASKVGRKKIWLADGSYKYILPGKCAETALLFNVL
jgi:hypothetical protein